MTPGVSRLKEDLENNVVCSWMVWSYKNRTSIHTAKYADDVTLLAKKETVLQSMTDRLDEFGWHYVMEMNVEMTQMKISKQWPPSPNTDYERSKATGEWWMFHLAW